MTKDFDLQSPQWLEILFEGKNKRYGAYQLRDDSSNRHIKSLIVVIVLGLAAIFLPNIIENMILSQNTVAQDEAFAQTEFNTTEEQKKPEQQQEEMVIPQETRDMISKAIKLTEATVVEDVKIQVENLAQANEALKNIDAEISTKTVENGVTDGSGFNPDDYKQVVETTTPETEKVYTWVQVKPSFPGGEEARLKWLRENLEYPQQAVADEIQGLVQVGFVVEKDGSITNVKVVQSAHSTLDREAVRLVKAMPKWIPGKQNGNTVRAYFTQPIRFVLRN